MAKSKRSRKTSASRVDYRAERPDVHKKIKRTVKSCGEKAAADLLDGTVVLKRRRLMQFKATPSHKKTLTKAIEKMNQRKERKAKRASDPKVQKRLAKRRVDHCKTRLDEVTELIKIHRNVDIGDIGIVDTDDKGFVVRVQSVITIDELRRIEKHRKKLLAEAKIRLKRVA